MLNRRRLIGVGVGLGLASGIAATGASFADTPRSVPAAGAGRVLAPGPAGWWDSERVSCPRVLRLADGRWRMWYYGRDPTFNRAINLPSGRAGVAESADGIHWRRLRGPLTMGAVLEPSADAQRFDSGHVGITDVHLEDHGYSAWYMGGRRVPVRMGEREVTGIPIRPGRALSADGLHWRKLDGPHDGAMLDVGAPGSFDPLLVGWPQALQEPDGSTKLYYHTFQPGAGFMACLAVSTDGARWEKLGPVLQRGAPGDFDENGPATRQVIRRGGEYLMFYEGMHGARHASIGLARSDDGIHWTRVRGAEAGGAILAHAPTGSGRWDAEGVGTPWVVADGRGGFHLYYVGANDNPNPPGQGIDELGIVHQIGLAVSDGDDLTRWRRWAGD